MPKLDKALRRDRKRDKRKYDHRRDGDSVKELQRILEKKRAEVLKKKREEKEKNES